MCSRFIAAVAAAFSLWFPLGSVDAKVLRVPDDFGRIPDAMHEARYGDSVLVEPGKYDGPVDVKNGVVLKSTDGPEVTTIVGYRWWVVRMADADTVTALIGFTVDGGKGADRIVYCSGGGSPRVLDNVIQKGWRGISCEGSSAILRGNLIQECKQGIGCVRASPLIVRNHVTKNGRGIVLTDGYARLEQNVVDLNQIGIVVEEYAIPVLGGSAETANDIFDNHGYNIQNMSKIKDEGIRTLKPALLTAEYNYWGSNCPLKRKFMGAVDYKPWIGEDHSQILTSCPEE